MKNNKPSLYIFGAGGHARVVRDLITHDGVYDFAGFVAPGNAANTIAENDFMAAPPPGAAVVIAIGENAIRAAAYDRLKSSSVTLPSLVHPRAFIGGDVRLGPGTVVMAGALINTGAKIGAACVVNSGSIIEHDCILDDVVSVAPGAVICGGTRIGEGAYIGAGAIVIHGQTIGSWSVLGAGSVAVKPVAPLTVNVGVPARLVRARTREEKAL